MEWKVELLDEMFNERDRKCILAIHLSSSSIKDELTWAFSKDRKNTMKTSYMLGKRHDLDHLILLGSIYGALKLV